MSNHNKKWEYLQKILQENDTNHICIHNQSHNQPTIVEHTKEDTTPSEPHYDVIGYFIRLFIVSLPIILFFVILLIKKGIL